MTVPPRGSGAVAMPPMDHAARRDRLRGSLDGLWLLVSAPANVRYLSGFAGSAGHVLIGPAAAADRVVTDDRYAQRVAVDAPDLRATIDRDAVGVALAAVVAGGTGGGVAGGVAGAVPGGDGAVRGRPRLGVEADHLTWSAAQDVRMRARDRDVEVVGTTGAVAALRAVKDDAEVARLARACELTVAALDWLLADVVAPGVTERQLAVALERRFVDLGADGVAFPSIVASGPNAAVPHHEPSARPLEVGDVLTVDCGALVDGYHADYTRTVGVRYLSKELSDIYEVVRAAQEAGRRAAVVGATAGDVDAAARGVVEDAGFGARFLHGTGHGVGLDIHEAPAVAKGSGAALVVGTTLTVEPGVYVPGLGGVRIEDTLVMREDGRARVLTDAPHALRLVGD